MSIEHKHIVDIFIIMNLNGQAWRHFKHYKPQARYGKIVGDLNIDQLQWPGMAKLKWLLYTPFVVTNLAERNQLAAREQLCVDHLILPHRLIHCVLPINSFWRSQKIFFHTNTNFIAGISSHSVSWAHGQQNSDLAPKDKLVRHWDSAIISFSLTISRGTAWMQQIWPDSNWVLVPHGSAPSLQTHLS